MINRARRLDWFRIYKWQFPPRQLTVALLDEAHAWKACLVAILTRVRISFSPPTSFFHFLLFILLILLVQLLSQTPEH